MRELCRSNPWLSWIIAIICAGISYAIFDIWWVSLLIFFFILGSLSPDENENIKKESKTNKERNFSINEFEAHNMINKLYLGTYQSFNNKDYPNIYKIDSYYKDQILKIISDATSGNLKYDGKLPLSQSFSNGIYKIYVHGAEYDCCNARVCQIYSSNSKILTIVWGDDTIEQYRNHEEGYTISPLHGLTK